MRNILFDKDLSFEINVIGYKMKGESILFFLKSDGKAVYAGGRPKKNMNIKEEIAKQEEN